MMKKLLQIVGAVLAVSLLNPAYAQFTPGQVLTSAQLNAALAAPRITGGTITGLSAPIPLASGGTGASTATGATSQLQYLQGATGSVARSVTSKLQDVVSILDFPGCDKTGTTDSTACMQAALNSGALGVYVPAGEYKESGLTLPQTIGFTLFGDGPSSVIIQTGGSIHFATTGYNSNGTIRDLKFDGTAGTANTIDTSYSAMLDLLNLYFNNVPVGFASLKLDGNPTLGIYTHDIRASNIRIYSTTAGKAGIELGSWLSDSLIDRFIMSGDFLVSYNLLADVNAQTVALSNSHIYGAAINVVRLSGTNSSFSWTDDILDNSLSDTFYSLNSINSRFTNVWIEAINTAQRGIVFDGSFNNSIEGLFCSANGVTNAASCVAEVNGSSGNKVVGAQIDALSNYTTPFNISGSGSYVSGVPGYSSYASVYSLVGATTSAQLQSTVTNLGINGSQTSIPQTAFPVPLQGIVRSATVLVDATPASGQTFTFALQKNGTTIGTGTISNGSFTATITLNPFVAVDAGDQLSILSTFSATSGSANLRYFIMLQG